MSIAHISVWKILIFSRVRVCSHMREALFLYMIFGSSGTAPAARQKQDTRTNPI